MADRKSPAPSGAAIDTKLVRTLAEILGDTGLSEIEVESGDLKIKVSRQAAATSVSYAAPAPIAAPAPAAAPATASAPAPAEAAPMRGDAVKSPMVGTVYLQPQPGSPSFVKPGDKVKEGQTLLIIEAMKTMNPIPAPRAGTVVEILVGDAQPVEFGEPLVVIE
ncbi:MAG: acetyl-CoA carboxylase biotin carboxyl carrier protein [Caulobacteraceae bacterium]|nr:acetyl-CoA carboxylase biotin carboxyl carrier protein [Caulobacteraceae bacterium]